MNRQAAVISARFICIVTLCAVVGVAGCCGKRGSRTVITVSQGQQSQAVLAGARESNISLFGDLPGNCDVTYYSRSAMALRQHTFTEVGTDYDVDVDPTGKRMVFASTRHHTNPDLYIKGVDGVAVTQLTADPAPDIQPSYSPDGQRIAFASLRSGNWDIWIVGVDGGPPVQVTRSPADEVHPSWSPDGTSLVYCSLPATGGQWELWIADVLTGSSNRFIGYGLFPEWSPRGDRIVFQRARERGSRWFSIWTITLVNGEPRFPTEVSASTTEAMIVPTWSADGSQIAFASTPTVPPPPMDGMGTSGIRLFDIWIMDEDGRHKTRLTDGHTANHAPVFSIGGRVFFTANRSGNDNIWSLLPGPRQRASDSGETMTQNAVPAGGDARKVSLQDNL